MSGGEIEVSSRLGEGSTFSFTVPISRGRPEPISVASHYQPQTQPIEAIEGVDPPTIYDKGVLRDDHIILVVDDEPVNREVMRQLLGARGYRVRFAENGPEALAVIAECRVHLVLLDIMMPGMSGFDVAREIRKSYSLHDLPILMITARNQVTDVLTGFEAGANDYLSKPVDKRELFARINTLLTLEDAVSSALRHQRQLREEQTRAVALENEKAVLAYRARESRRAEEEALEISRQKTDFIALMSHELRTPLNAIIGYSEILHEDITAGRVAELVGDVLKIQTSARNLLSMINNLLDLTKIEAGKMDLFLEEFRIALLFEEVEATIRPLAGKNKNQLEIRVADNIDRICADVAKLRQVLLNLLGNACKFTRNGRVRLLADRIDGPESPLIRIRVVDNGIGITESQQARLFQPFSQAERSTARHYGGTGLGLTISKRFLEMMRGEITVDSLPDEGTTFTITLPRLVPGEG